MRLHIEWSSQVLDEDGETTNLPDDDASLEAGGDGVDGPRWMEYWSQACKDIAAANDASTGCSAVTVPIDEFNVAFMTTSAEAYNIAAGLSRSSTAKL